MPTYQYACTDCDHAFDLVQRFSEDSLTVCPACEGRLRKIFNAVGVVFKGSGFYRNDSRADAKSDAKSASASTSAKSKSNDSSGSKSTPSDSSGSDGSTSGNSTADSSSSTKSPAKSESPKTTADAGAA